MDVVSKVALGIYTIYIYIYTVYIFILLYFIIFNLQIWLIHRLKVQVTISTKLISATGQEPQTPFQQINPREKLFGKNTKPVFLDLKGMTPLP